MKDSSKSTDRHNLSERLNAPPKSTITVDVAQYEALSQQKPV